MKSRAAQLARTTGVLECRAPLHLGYRWATRAYEAVLGYRAGSTRQMAAAAACALGDGLVGLALVRSRRVGLPARLAADAVDAAAWSLAVRGSYDAAVLVGVPLAMEAGMRLGVAGLVAPAASAAFTAAVRARAGRRLGLSAFAWQVLGVAGGRALGYYEERRWQAESLRHEQELQARSHDAYLTGQSEVAMGADSVVDLLSRTGPLLEDRAGPTGMAAELASWKAALAATVSRRAAYLGTAVAEWQKRANRHPDLSADVSLDLAEGQGTAVLSGTQVALLGAGLDGLGLRGRHQLVVEDAGGPGRDRRLRLGRHLLVLPADPATRALAFDPGPALLAISADWYLSALSPTLEAAPLWAGMPPGLCCAALAVWADRLIRQNGPAARSSILAATLAVSAVQTTLVTPTMAYPLTDQGLARFPTTAILPPVLILARLYWADLSLAQRRATLAGALGLVALSWALFPVPVGVIDALAANLWVIGVIPAVASVARALRAQSATLAEELAGREKALTEAAYAEGRSAVLDLVARVRSGLWQRYHQDAPGTDPCLRAEAGRRLAEVDRRLEDLACPAG